MKTPISLIKGDKISSNTDYRDYLPVNMYAVKKEVLGASGYLLTYPGLSLHGTGHGIDRGGVYNDRFSNQYRVSGTNMISVSSSGATSVLGTIPGTGPARMKSFYSFNTQAVIADGRMFLYSPSGGFSEVTDADLGTPIDGVWVDGYYFLTDGEYIYHTDIADESAIDPLKFATAEFMPDKSLGLLKTSDNKVIVFGRYTMEYFVNDSSDNFAFQRVETRGQKIGIVATHAKCELNGSIYITGGRKEDAVGVYSVGLGQSAKISTREIDKILATYTESGLANMRMDAYEEDSTSFVIIHLPNETICFNETIAKDFGIDVAWCSLKTDTIGTNPYRAINYVYDPRVSGWICGDILNSNIGLLDKTIATHYGSKVEWLLYSPFIKIESMSVDEIDLETIPGYTSEADASVAVSITYDGNTYGTEWFELYGQPSDYNKRFILRRLGYVPDWIGFKFRGINESRMAFALMEVSYS